MALDAEMVGVAGTGSKSAKRKTGGGSRDNGQRSVLAQVVVCDYAGRVIFCSYVKPPPSEGPVIDWRTAVSGIEPKHLLDSKFGAISFEEAQKKVAELVRGKTLVGHGLSNDLQALRLGHPWRAIRDSSHYRPFCYRSKKDGKLRPRKLKHLAAEHLGIVIQEGEGGHDPAEDARAALALYRKHRREWEASLASSASGAGGSAAAISSIAAGGAAATVGSFAPSTRSPRSAPREGGSDNDNKGNGKPQKKSRGISRHLLAREEKRKQAALSTAAIASAGAGFFASSAAGK